MTPAAPHGRIDIDTLPGPQRLARRIALHWHWARTQGVRRLIEEDQLDPFDRARGAARRWWWRQRHAVAPGSATPVFLVGLQRSGTNMTVRAFEASPEFEVHNENDRRAFDRFQLRSDRVIRSLIEHSGHRYVLFKPLCDSHRIVHLLDHLGAGSPGRAFWVYRSVDGRVRSSLAKFGDNNLQVLREIAQGRGEGMWQAQRMSADTLALIHDLDLDSTSAETAAALFWYARNSLYFEMGLDRRNDVMLVSYDSFVRRADEHLQAMCAFLGCEFRPETAAAIAPRGASLALPLAIDPAIRLLCDGLDQRLSAAAASALRRFDASAEADGVAAAG